MALGVTSSGCEKLSIYIYVYIFFRVVFERCTGIPRVYRFRDVRCARCAWRKFSKQQVSELESVSQSVSRVFCVLSSSNSFFVCVLFYEQMYLRTYGAVALILRNINRCVFGFAKGFEYLLSDKERGLGRLGFATIVLMLPSARPFSASED